MGIKLNIDDIRKSFESEGYKLLTINYLNNTQKLEFICPNNHEHYITWANWRKGRRCGNCSKSKKKTITEVMKSFESEGYELLTTDYINSSQKLNFICPKGHKHSISWDAWKNGIRCGVCAGKYKTIFDIRKSFESEGYKLLTIEYINAQQNLEFICPNDHKHSISWNSWANGTRCGKCFGSVKKDINDIRKSFELEGYKLLTIEYINAQQKLEFICPNDHKHSISWTHWRKGHRCSICIGQIITIDDIRKSFELEGYKLLTIEYINAQQNLEFICPNDHKHSISWNSWKRGSRCGKCFKPVNQKHIEFIRNSFKSEGYELLTTEYQNAHQKLEYICPNGHKHSIQWNSWQQSHRCGKCFGLHKNIDDIREKFKSEGYYLLTTEYIDNEQKLEYICPNGHKHSIRWNSWLKNSRCGKCSNTGKSKAEKEIVEFLKPYFPDLLENDRSIINPLELDIVIPSKKIAIEYCGLYWHSEIAGKKRNYHVDKLLNCKETGYRLITIFEDEWINQKDIVKSRLKQIFGISDAKRIHARRCSIKEINTKESSPFLKKFHIQGVGVSNIKLGAFYDNELVSVMTFSRPSVAKGSKDKDFWELNRFCSHSGYHIPGIASKLLKYFERNYDCEKIVSYADRRWSDGNLYKKLGFDCVSETKPNYWYFNGESKRIHRFALRKKSGESKDQTEWELRQTEGWNRIWDCGSLKFEKGAIL